MIVANACIRLIAKPTLVPSATGSKIAAAGYSKTALGSVIAGM